MPPSTRRPAPRTPQRIWRRAIEILRESGPAGLIFLVLSDLGYRRVLLLERRIERAIAPIAAQVPVAFSRLEAQQIDEYLRFHAGDAREQVETRFARGDACYVARCEGRIACASWVARDAHYIRFVRFQYAIPATEVYLYDSFTDPDLRGRRVAPALGAYVLERLRCEGVTRATIAVTPENTANRRAREKTGFRVCGRITCFALGGRTWHWQRGIPT